MPAIHPNGNARAAAAQPAQARRIITVARPTGLSAQWTGKLRTPEQVAAWKKTRGWKPKYENPHSLYPTYWLPRIRAAMVNTHNIVSNENHFLKHRFSDEDLEYTALHILVGSAFSFLYHNTDVTCV